MIKYVKCVPITYYVIGTHLNTSRLQRKAKTYRIDPDQTASEEAVIPASSLFAFLKSI